MPITNVQMALKYTPVCQFAVTLTIWPLAMYEPMRPATHGNFKVNKNA